MASSLEILRPTPSHRTLSRPTPTTSTATHLESTSITISRALATNDTRNPILKAHLASDFTSEDPRSRLPTCTGFDVISVSANVDEERGRASVWLLSRERDTRDRGLSGESVTVLSWWKERGMWRCWRQSAVRGVSGFPPSWKV